MLAVGGLDCWVQVGVPGRGRAHGSCLSRLPPCSPAASLDSAAALCPSLVLFLDGNLRGEGPLGPAIKFYHESCIINGFQLPGLVNNLKLMHKTS